MEDKEYIILLTIYKKMFKDKNNIIPNEWYNVKEYKIKKEILEDCINNKILIVNSKLYYDFRLLSLN